MTKYVIEMSDKTARQLADDMKVTGWSTKQGALPQLIAQIPKPRIEEPPWGEKVRATRPDDSECSGVWLHAAHGYTRWTNGARWVSWNELTDPEVIK